MDSVSCVLVNKTEDSCQESCENLDEIGTIEADNEKVGPLLEPRTPDSKKENGDFQLEFNSPLTVGKKIPKVFVFNSKAIGNKNSKTSVEDSGSPQTPNAGVFDPFAPGPEDKVLAPHCRLDFSSSFNTLGKRSSDNDAESISDEEILESVYKNLLEVIVSNQTEDTFAELSNFEWDASDCRTPSSTSRLSDVSDTCPGAPVKRGRSKIVDLRLCRRLEF